MKFSNVTNPQWANAEHSAIDCVVMFDHIGEPVPFTANQNDSAEHGRDIFALCESGAFGAVADYVPPPPPPEPVSEPVIEPDTTQGQTAA